VTTLEEAPSVMEEIVDLPDPETQPLVHPLDLPEARAEFRRAWLVGAATGLPVAALVAGIIAYLTTSVVAPIIAFLALTVFGTLAKRWATNRAWDYIPRKRQDRARPLPRAWDLGAAAILALVLGIALLLIVYRLDDADVPLDVRSFTFGMCAVAALLILADAVFGLLRPAGRSRALASLPGVAVVAVATVLAYVTWFDGDADSSLLFWGAGSMAAAGLLAGAGRIRERRRAAE
jgi:MFS family permease